MHCWIPNSILGLYPLDTSNPLPSVMTNVSRHFWKSPGRQNCLWLETTVMRARVMAKRMVMTAKSLPAETWGFWSAQVRTRHWVVSTWTSQVYNSRPTDPPRAHHCDLGTCDEPETAPLPTTPISLRPCRSFSLPLCLHCHITKRNYEGLCKALLFFFFPLLWNKPRYFYFYYSWYLQQRPYRKVMRPEM